MENIKSYTPKVREAAVFKEIAQNIVNPLEIIREGLSNSFDADSKHIIITVKRDENGNFIVEIDDDGNGMALEDLHSFFNLGDSNKHVIGIGEKGLGTKTYYKSDKITVLTKSKSEIAFKAVMDRPWDKLIQGEVPNYTIEELISNNNLVGTKVIIENYKVDNPERYFNLETIKDYILWFTAGGSFKNLFANYTELYKSIKNMQIAPRITIDDKIAGNINEVVGVHQFSPPQELPIEDPDEVVYKRSVNYCRHFGPFHKETNINNEYVSLEIYGTISGINCRKAICKPRQGETYKSRFGIYLCKDFIPFTRRNDLLGDEHYYHYHILVNSQSFELTADRNNLSNENDAKVKWVLNEAKSIIHNSIKPLCENGYFALREKEEEDYNIECRMNVLNKSLESSQKLDDLMVSYIPIVKKPFCEIQVALLFISLLSNEYTKRWIDSIKKVITYNSKSTTDMICIDHKDEQALTEVEFRLSNLIKHQHPLGTIDYVICWEIDIELNSPKQFSGGNAVLIYENGKYFLRYGDNDIIEVIELKGIINSIISEKSYEKENL